MRVVFWFGEKRLRVLWEFCAGPACAESELTDLRGGSNEAACGAERRRAAGGGVSFGPLLPLHVADMGINESTALG